MYPNSTYLGLKVVPQGIHYLGTWILCVSKLRHLHPAPTLNPERNPKPSTTVNSTSGPEPEISDPKP